MKKSLFLMTAFTVAATLQALPSALHAQQITGPWKGTLDAGNQKLEVIFRFSHRSDGSSAATMDVPAQSATGIPAKLNALTADSVSLEVAAISMSYTGKLENGIIRGSFTQMGVTFPLELEQGDNVRKIRPQEPAKPYPYETEDIKIRNARAGIMLSGTLTYPVGYKKGDKVPVVIMISGSGGQNRDEEIFEHRPFLVIAEHLAKHGIASFRYDDRGIGKSGGTQSGCTSADFAGDAEAVAEYLKAKGEFCKTGILGHSEGGMIAFMLGAKDKADFIISMAGPGIQGDTLLAEQKNAISRLRGFQAQFTASDVRKELETMEKRNIWLEYFFDYDPRHDLEKITVPVMAINGSNDLQVIPESNLEAIRKILSGRNRHNLIKEYPDLNHLFQHCTPATAMSYYEIDETCSPEVLDDIAEWIRKLM